MIDNQKVLNEMFNIPHGLKPVANISGMKLYSSKGLMKKYAKAILNTKYFKGSKRLEELIIDKNKIIPCYLTKSLIGYTFYKLFASTQRKSICGFFSPQSKRIYILISNNTAFGIYSSNNDLASLTLHETMHAYFDQSPSDFKSMFKKKIAEYYDHFVSYVFDVPDNKITKSTGKSIAKMMLDFEYKSSAKGLTGNDVKKHIEGFISLLKNNMPVIDKQDEQVYDLMERMMLAFMFNQSLFFSELNKYRYFFKGFYYAYFKTFGTTDTQTLPIQELFYPSEIIAIGSEVSKNKSSFITAFNKLKV